MKGKAQISIIIPQFPIIQEPRTAAAAHCRRAVCLSQVNKGVAEHGSSHGGSLSPACYTCHAILFQMSRIIQHQGFSRSTNTPLLVHLTRCSFSSRAEPPIDSQAWPIPINSTYCECLSKT